MDNCMEKLLLYEEYKKEMNILNNLFKSNKQNNIKRNNIKRNNIKRNNIKHKDDIKNEKRIVIYKNYEYDYKYKYDIEYSKKVYDMYIVYLFFSATIYQLIIGNDKINKYFGANSNL